ncbi:hypothetical protein SEVIR_3G373120v4 [Setaria viridis]
MAPLSALPGIVPPLHTWRGSLPFVCPSLPGPAFFPPSVSVLTVAPPAATLDVVMNPLLDVTLALSLAPAAEEVRAEPVLPISPGGEPHGSLPWSGLGASEDNRAAPDGRVAEVRVSPEFAQANVLMCSLPSPDSAAALEVVGRAEEPLMAGLDVPIVEVAPSSTAEVGATSEGVPTTQEWAMVPASGVAAAGSSSDLEMADEMVWPHPEMPGKAHLVLRPEREKELWALLGNGGASMQSGLSSLVEKMQEILGEAESVSWTMYFDLPRIGEVNPRNFDLHVRLIFMPGQSRAVLM